MQLGRARAQLFVETTRSEWASLAAVRRQRPENRQLPPSTLAAIQWELLRIQVQFSMDEIMACLDRIWAQVSDCAWALRWIRHNSVALLVEAVDMLLTCTRTLLIMLALAVIGQLDRRDTRRAAREAQQRT